MSKYDKRIKILYILLIIVIFFIFALTYIHIKKTYNKTNYNDDDIEVKFNNTSNIAIVNVKSKDEITKSFNVKNRSNRVIYYNIKFDNITSNFNEEDLSYFLVGSENAAYVSDANILNSNLASSIKLNPHENHNYILKILVNDENPTNKTFSTNLKIIESNPLLNYKKGTLGDKILTNNKVLSNNDVNISDNEGLFYTNNSNNGITIYFFKGSNLVNNNVRIDNICYKIIRTTENGGIRLIYNGTYENESCKGNDNIIGNSEFNIKSNYNAYIGYMYGIPNSNDYKDEHSNINSSKIKINIDNFYSKYLGNISNIIDNSIYCNNRKTYDFTIKNVNYGVSGIKNNNTGYKSTFDLLNNKLSFVCHQENDQLTMPTLSNPIGLLTVEEALFAGIGNNQNNYLDSENSYWTMTPAYFDGSNAYNYIVKDGNLWQNIVSETHGIRPVITLKSDVMVKQGNGDIQNPYVIDK